MNWISVKDKLPELEVEVLGLEGIRADGKPIFSIVCRVELETHPEDSQSTKWYWHSDALLDSEPTHWMPLPEIPK
jgi:hypothetical protein